MSTSVFCKRQHWWIVLGVGSDCSRSKVTLSISVDEQQRAVSSFNCWYAPSALQWCSCLSSCSCCLAVGSSSATMRTFSESQVLHVSLLGLCRFTWHGWSVCVTCMVCVWRKRGSRKNWCGWQVDVCELWVSSEYIRRLVCSTCVWVDMRSMCEVWVSGEY